MRTPIHCNKCYLSNFDLHGSGGQTKCYSCNHHYSQKGEHGKYCKLCFEKVVGLLDAEALRKEYDARVQKTMVDCSPTGKEPALQLLILPAIGIWDSSQCVSYSLDMVASTLTYVCISTRALSSYVLVWKS